MLYIPKTLDDAKMILERTAQKGMTEENKSLVQSIKDLNKAIDTLIDAGSKVCHFFENIIYCITHPVEFLGALQPWLLIALFVIIILKLIGFDVDKWFVLVFLILVLVIMFC